MEEWEVDFPDEYENEEGAERFRLSLAAERGAGRAANKTSAR